MPVYLFKDTDAGAPALTGQVSSLITILDECLCLKRLFTTADDSAFNDQSAEARTPGGTAFTLFPTPGTSDRAYFGMQMKFRRLIVDLATLGVGGTYVWEYWSGSAWSSMTVTDGTGGFTADGIVTWTPPGNWATTAVNGVTAYWVRVRPSGAPSTNPTVNSCSSLGWFKEFSGTNKAAYKQSAGNGFYIRVDDSGPGAGGARECRLRGFETMSDVDTGTGPFPTVAQLANGCTFRKSSTLDATARTWVLLADDRMFYLFCISGDIANTYFAMGFGDIYSFAGSGDGYRTGIFSRIVENTGADGNETFGTLTTALTTAQPGHYLARSYTGTGSAVTAGKHGDQAKGHGTSTGWLSTVLAYPHPVDGGLWLARVIVQEPTASVVRGYLRGIYAPLHNNTFAPDRDTFSGVGALSGRTFMLISLLGSQGTKGIAALETSDTWDTN